ncbi:MAG: hypothetical protein WCW31_02825 [Patescibacteria group bacterium]|jgi:multidrug transporter EmrE-like cation transporter
MLGLFLTVLGTIFDEVTTSIGKIAIKSKVENVFTFGFLSNLVCALFFLVLIMVRLPEQGISLWPTFLIRIVSETILSFITILAIVKCTRSTFGFIRVGTIPLLLVVDVIIGYSISNFQILGIVFVTFSLLYLFLNHGLDKRGLGLAILATILPVVTISLAKYDFNHGNSIELEQGVVYIVMTILFFIMALRSKENPFVLFKKPLVMLQFAAQALGAVLLTYSFNIMTPSVHTAAKRATSVAAAVASGKLVFKEKKIILKIVALVICILGIILLAVGK